MMVELLMENQNKSRRLDDLERFGHRERLRDAVRQASLARRVLAVVLPPSLVRRFGRRLEQHLQARGDTVRSARGWRDAARSLPDSRQVRLSVKRSCDGRRQNGRAV